MLNFNDTCRLQVAHATNYQLSSLAATVLLKCHLAQTALASCYLLPLQAVTTIPAALPQLSYVLVTYQSFTFVIAIYDVGLESKSFVPHTLCSKNQNLQYVHLFD
ncbi:hypothetical protein SO802_005553 [Lithocarpus litseifolius]|uniref:Uncharacterized protein n=1 Tax=Lithocarpus litseifolius TaxID=425828 RepID=A0AAW2DMB0_9ROSI